MRKRKSYQKENAVLGEFRALRSAPQGVALRTYALFGKRASKTFRLGCGAPSVCSARLFIFGAVMTL
jgi:hypothetical protein